MQLCTVLRYLLLCLCWTFAACKQGVSYPQPTNQIPYSVCSLASFSLLASEATASLSSQAQYWLEDCLVAGLNALAMEYDVPLQYTASYTLSHTYDLTPQGERRVVADEVSDLTVQLEVARGAVSRVAGLTDALAHAEEQVGCDNNRQCVRAVQTFARLCMVCDGAVTVVCDMVC